MEKISKERRAEIKEEKHQRRASKLYRKEGLRQLQVAKVEARKELKILQYMLKTDVIYYHHGQEESMKSIIKSRIEDLKVSIKESHVTDCNSVRAPKYTEYHPYYWNYSSPVTSYMPLCYLGCLPACDMYSIPLDGTHVFYITDSGQRGLGTFNYIKAKKVEAVVQVPKVDPGAIIPITHI